MTALQFRRAQPLRCQVEPTGAAANAASKYAICFALAVLGRIWPDSRKRTVLRVVADAVDSEHPPRTLHQCVEEESLQDFLETSNGIDYCLMRDSGRT